MGADELPTQSQGQTAMKAVNGPGASTLVLNRTHRIYLIYSYGSPAQKKRVKNNVRGIRHHPLMCVCVSRALFKQ